MQLLRIRIENLRQYGQPAVLDDLRPGLNLFVGPNGCGKSTWVRAIRAAFFERHRSKSPLDLVPWRAPSAAPEITIDFLLDGVAHQLAKRFMRNPHCRVQTGRSHLDADEAERYLATALGYEVAERGASRPEAMGVPGLLWMEQGEQNDVGEPVRNALNHLRGALQQSIGSVTSTSGDDILATLQERLADLRGKTRSVGALREAEEALARAAADVDGRSAELAAFCERVDALASLRRERQRDRETRPWEQFEQQANRLRGKLEQSAALTARQRELDHGIEALRDRIALLDSRRQHRELLESRLAARSATRDQVADVVAEFRETESQARSLALRAQLERDAAFTALEAVRVALRRDELKGRLREYRARVGELDLRHQQSTEAQQQLARLADEMGRLAMAPAEFDALRERDQKIARLMASVAASATHVGWTLHPARSMLLDGEIVMGAGSREITSPARLTIDGVGELSIEPGGVELAEARRELGTLQQEQHDRLDRFGLTSMAGAQARIERLSALQAEVVRHQTRLDSLAPDGLAVLARDRAQAGAELARVAQEIETLAAEVAVVTDAADAQAVVAKSDAAEAAAAGAEGATSAEPSMTTMNLAAAQAMADEREKHLARARAAADAAATALTTALANQRHAELEWQAATIALADERERTAAVPVDGAAAGADPVRLDPPGAIAQLEIELEALLRERRALVASLAEVDDTVLKGELQRCEASATVARAEANDRELQEVRLSSQLSEAGAGGLDEALAMARAEHLRAQRRCQELTVRADALGWLVDQMLRHRSALTQRLQAPLQARIDHYMRRLLPRARLEIDGDLVPFALFRQSAVVPPAVDVSMGPAASRASGGADFVDASPGATEPVADQSYGTREQLALLARLAYADLLAQAGRPTLIILDDGLVHADEDRLEGMKQMLYDAATRHQVLVFSCHPQRWEGLGVAARAIPAPVWSPLH